MGAKNNNDLIDLCHDEHFLKALDNRFTIKLY